MKKKIIPIFLAILTGIVIYSCRKEFDGPEKVDRNARLTVKEANAFFKSHYKPSTTERSLSRGQSAGLRPQWHRARLGATSRSSFVEMPLPNPGLGFTLYNFDDNGKPIPSDPTIAKYVFKRLIIYKNSINGEILTRVLTYVPDMDYLKRNDFDATKARIKALNGFSGYIEVQTADNQPISIHRYRNGRKLFKLKASSNAIKPNATAKNVQARGSMVVCTPIYQWGCWADADSPTGETCSEPTQTGENCETVYYPDPDPNPDPDPDPNEPGEGEQPPGGGDPGYNPGTSMAKEINNNTTDPCLHNTVQQALASNSNVKGTISSIINKFAQHDTGLTINIFDTLTSGQAATHITSSVSNAFVITINFNPQFFSDISKEAVVTRLTHEAVHAYLLYTNNDYRDLPQAEHHNHLFTKYIADLGIYLMNKYEITKEEAFGLAWSGTELFNLETDFEKKFATLNGDSASKSDLHAAAVGYTDNSPATKKGTPNCPTN